MFVGKFGGDGMNDANSLHLFLWSLEGLIFFFGLAASGVLAFKWCKFLLSTWPKLGKRQVIASVAGAPIVSLIMIFAVIRSLAAPSVTESVFYVLGAVVFARGFAACVWRGFGEAHRG